MIEFIFDGSQDIYICHLKLAVNKKQGWNKNVWVKAVFQNKYRFYKSVMIPKTIIYKKNTHFFFGIFLRKDIMDLGILCFKPMSKKLSAQWADSVKKEYIYTYLYIFTSKPDCPLQADISIQGGAWNGNQPVTRLSIDINTNIQHSWKHT